MREQGTNREFYCTGVIIYNKLDNYFFVSADRQTFLCFEMTANLRDTSPLRLAKLNINKFPHSNCMASIVNSTI